MAQPSLKPGWAVAIALALAVVLTYFFFATRTTLFDRDEPRFSSAAVEMVRSGNYLFPTFNGKLRPDKPILIYWLMAPAVRLLGPVEAAVRLPSVLAAGATSLLVFWLGRRLFDARTGLLAAAILATSPLMLLIGTAATADSVLLFTLTACFCIWADAFVRGRMSALHTLLLGLALGAAQLAKGPVGLAIPLLGILTSHLLVSRPWTRWTRRAADASPSSSPPPLALPSLIHPAIALAISLGIFLLWAVPANNATNGEFLRLGVGHHVVKRIATPLESHGGNWFLTLPYYLPVLAAAFFPWTLFLLGAVSGVLGGRIGDARVRALLIAWTLPTFLLMSVVSTKLPHYILPIFPALAIAVAATIRAIPAGTLSEFDRRRVHNGGALFAPVLVAGLGAAAFLWLMPASLVAQFPGLALVAAALRAPAAILAAFALILAGSALLLHLRWRFEASARLLGMTMVLFIPLLGLTLLPRLEAIKPSAALAQIIHLHSDPRVAVASCDFGEPSFNFYVNRPPIEYLGVEHIDAWSRRPGPGVLVISRSDFDRALESSSPLPLEQLGHAQGLSNSRLRPLDLLVLARNLHEARSAPTQD